MKKTWKAVLIRIALYTLILAFAMPVPGRTFGDFDSDSDWGGSDDYDSGWSSDDYDSGWDSDDYDSGWNWGARTGGRTGGRELSDAEGILILIMGVSIVLLVGIYFYRSRTTYSKPSDSEYWARLRSSETSKAKPGPAIPPDLDVPTMKTRLKQLYLHMQEDWEKGDMQDLRPYFEHTVFNRFANQLKYKGENHQVDRVRHVIVGRILIEPGKYHDQLNVTLIGSYVTWMEDTRTGKLLSGSKDIVRELTYQITLGRTKGMSGTLGQKCCRAACASCGCETWINENGVCERCGRLLLNSDFNWVITDMKAVRQLSSRLGQSQIQTAQNEKKSRWVLQDLVKEERPSEEAKASAAAEAQQDKHSADEERKAREATELEEMYQKAVHAMDTAGDSLTEQEKVYSLVFNWRLNGYKDIEKRRKQVKKRYEDVRNGIMNREPH